MGQKRTKKTCKDSRQYQKETANIPNSNDREYPLWTFEDVDRDGEFKFDPARADFDAKNFLQKVISLSTMTWAEIIKQTHDNGKSKHHFLSSDSLSKEAKKRIAAKKLEDLTDQIFSFAFSNKLRVIGIRETDNPTFRVIWYDAEHKFSLIKNN